MKQKPKVKTWKELLTEDLEFLKALDPKKDNSEIIMAVIFPHLCLYASHVLPVMLKNIDKPMEDTIKTFNNMEAR